MLFRKPLLKTFNVVHDYSEATISIWIQQKRGTKWEVLSNQFSNMHGIDRKLLANLTVDIKQLIKVPQLSTMTAKKPLIKLMRNSQQTKEGHALNVYKLRGGVTNPLEGSPIKKTAEPRSFNTSVSLRITQGEQRTALLGEEWSLIWLLDKAAGNSTAHPGTEQLDIPRAFEPTVLTRTVHSPTCSAKNSRNPLDSTGICRTQIPECLGVTRAKSAYIFQEESTGNQHIPAESTESDQTSSTEQVHRTLAESIGITGIQWTPLQQ